MRPLVLALPLILAAAPALADRIDGGWCSADGAHSIVIDGPNATIQGGIAITGDYDRHSYAYTAPEGAPFAGDRIAMRQLSEQTARVILPDGPETWTRCQFTS